MPNNCYTVLPHSAEPRILLLQSGTGWSLPVFQPDIEWSPEVGRVTAAVEEALGPSCVVLHCAHVRVERVEGVRRFDAVYVMQPTPPKWLPLEGACWVTEDEFNATALTDEWPRPHVEAYFAEERSGTVPPLRPPWGRKGWYDEISKWTRHELEAHGLHLLEPLRQMKQWDISSVLKGRSEQGDIFFKAIPTIFATEPRITEGLSQRFPGIVPEPLAIWERPDEGRLLMRDFGGQILRDGNNGADPDPAHLEAVLRLLARMQISCIGHEEELFSISCHDRRIQNMASDLRALLADPVGTERLAEGEAERLHALIPAVEEAVDRLLNGPVPQTLMHGDFHDGNIADTEAGYVIFDWTDACVSHPFFDLLTITDVGDVPLTQEKKDHYTSVYLDEWAARGFGPPEALRETSDLTVRIAPLYHAISYWGINRRSEQATLVELGNALPHFLRMFMERMEG